MPKAKPFVLVTTKHRGVFAGHQKSLDGDLITLTEARCAIRWNTTGGFLELASLGPNKNSKIGAVAKEIMLYDVTSITVCTPEAEDAWKGA